jgi:succinate dehydrogenase/fumarate reductase flavoprotein subunit
MTELSRRRLIQGATLTAAVAAVPAANAAGKPKFDEMHDVVVVGSGFAGLAAALAAREAGADVLVIDKMAFVGGNSSLSGGMMAVPGSSVQKAQGIKDSPAQLMADMTRIGLGLGDPDHIRFVCEKASDTFEWTRRYIGVEWNEHLTGKGGHSASRCMITKQGTGQGIIVPAVAKLEKLGTEIRTGVFMEKILRSDTGCVTGVEVREGSSSKTPVTMPNETKMFRSVFLYMLPSRMEQKYSVRFFLTTSKNGVFLP